MDEYIKQFIVVIIILLLVSTYNIVKLMNNKYPSVLVDFIFHALFIFTGLFLFFYFYVKNLIRDDTNATFDGLLNTDSLPLEVIKEQIQKNLSAEQITEIKDILKNSIDNTNDVDTVIQESNKQNQSVLSTGIQICIVFFVALIVVTISLKYYFKYEINLTSILLVNLYVFTATLCIEYLILTIVTKDNIQPMSDSEFAKTVFDRFKYNLDNEF